MNSAWKDKKVAEIWRDMRIILEQNPAFADCYPQGDDGARWGSPLAFVAKANCLLAVLYLLHKGANPRKRLENDRHPYTKAKHNIVSKRLLNHSQTETIIPQEYNDEAVEQQRMRFGNMWGNIN